jgi:hypothetical protein
MFQFTEAFLAISFIQVIITGDFLCNPSNLGWAVMFGDSEVPAKVV